MGAFDLKDADIKRGSATGDGATVAYAIGWIPPSEQSMFITINGVLQQDAAYTISSSTLTFAAPPALADAIEKYEGGIIMITHNDEFCRQLCPERWVLEVG